MRQFHRFISEIRLWNAKRTHKQSVWVMVSLPVWMIFGLVRCLVTSASEISFDLFERIFYARLMVLMKETKSKSGAFPSHINELKTELITQKNGEALNGRKSLEQLCNAASISPWTLWPLTSVFSGIKQGGRPASGEPPGQSPHGQERPPVAAGSVLRGRRERGRLFRRRQKRGVRGPPETYARQRPVPQPGPGLRSSSG